MFANSVPRFVVEDEKLRATNIMRRRGGNCPNTIEVLQDLLDVQGNDFATITLSLLSVLPDRSSPAAQEIQRSLGPHVSTSTCLYRQAQLEPASSYIIRNLALNTRTIINYNALMEMTCAEFCQIASSFGSQESWYHFEGRIPNVTLECLRYLRKSFPHATRISVELEKPGREGLQELVPEADVVFYSKGWALGAGYQDPEQCLQAQAKLATKARFLCCTWGEQGASALDLETQEYYHAPGYRPDNVAVVDTIGAGDTFIAGMIYGCLIHHEDWKLEEKLDFSNELAGRKVMQEGFVGLANLMRHRL